MVATEAGFGRSPADRLITSSSEGDAWDHDRRELIRRYSDIMPECTQPPELAESSKNASTGSYVMLSAVVAAIGGFLFGYDTGIISGALLQLRDQYGLSCFSEELLVASMLMGALLGSLMGGFFVDYIGRKYSIILCSIIFILGAVVLACATSYAILIFGRVIIGFGVSLSATAECVYISEIAPVSRRGALVSLNELAITIGFLMAYLMDLAFINLYEGWRFMFGLAAVPAFVQCIALIFLPFSPRFLMIKNKEDLAHSTLVKLRGTDLVAEELSSIKASIQENKASSVLDLFRLQGNMLKRTSIALGLMGFQQLTGQANVLNYAPTIFQSIGYSNETAALLASVGLGVVKVIFTGVAILFIDRAGRRKLLLAGSAIMAVSLLILTILTATVSSANITDPCLPADVANVSIISPENSNLHPDAYVNSTTLESLPSRYMALGALMSFIAGYSISFGPVTWLVISEIFPSRLKGRAASLTATMNWGANLVVCWTFLDMLSILGIPTTFLIYAFVCFLSLCFVFFCVPETNGRTLEQIEEHLSDDTTPCPGASPCRLCCWDPCPGASPCRLCCCTPCPGASPCRLCCWDSPDNSYQDLDSGDSQPKSDSLQQTSEDMPMLPAGGGTGKVERAS